MPFSSPTTTSAVNEKRRPPLTTLATRLISTTRSCRSEPRSRSRVRSLDAIWMTHRSDRHLEAEAALARAVRQRLDLAVVAVAAPVEDARLDAGGLRAL